MYTLYRADKNVKQELLLTIDLGVWPIFAKNI